MKRLIDWCGIEGLTLVLLVAILCFCVRSFCIEQHAIRGLQAFGEAFGEALGTVGEPLDTPPDPG